MVRRYGINPAFGFRDAFHVWLDFTTSVRPSVHPSHRVASHRAGYPARTAVRITRIDGEREVQTKRGRREGEGPERDGDGGGEMGAREEFNHRPVIFCCSGGGDDGGDTVR